ncbi:hypothetical protein [Photobacterium leiognathi]|uniref:hypothetical protein n=1 Tax=Photobacterium leiognathi TaxID=553611 RepID=UPI0029822670|nr:hypothetical protein [Photobacterium leiognathi]
MSKEIVILPPTVTEVENLPLIADLQFLEVATSEALNRKLKGVIDAGVYQGFTYKLGSGLKLIIGDDSGKNTACVERGSVLMTVQGQHAVTLNIPAGKRSSVVIEAFYQYGVPTKQVDINSDVDAAKLLVVDSNKVLDHHVVLYDVTVPSDATQITDAMISTDRRTKPKWTIDEINGLREALDYKVSKTSRNNSGAIVVTTGTEEEKPATADLDDALLRFTKGLGFEGYNPELKEWGAIGGAGTPTFIITAENTTLRANKGYLFNVAAKSLIATLPANPKVGDWVAVGDYNGSCSHLKTIKIVTSDDSTIHGHANLTITDANTVITLSFVDETNQWKVVDGVGENSNGGVISKELEEVRAMLGAFVGQELSLPPTIADVNPALLPKEGGLYSRAAYPLLWNWLEQHPELLVSDADWQKHVSASPIKATPYYSLGNGVDTFRVPTVGIGGFSRAVGSESRSDIATGHQDQLQNITGVFSGAFADESNIEYSLGAFTFPWGSAGRRLQATGTMVRDGGVKFDASRVARTGNETQPKAFYNKVYIYSGNNALGIPTPTPQWIAQQQALTDQIAKAYTTENKPSWSDVGGEDFWTKNSAGSHIYAGANWVVPKARPEGEDDFYTGYLPVADGESRLGTNLQNFAESWVNEYHGKTMNLTSAAYAGHFITQKGAYPSLRVQGHSGKYFSFEYDNASGNLNAIHRQANGTNIKVWTFYNGGDFTCPSKVKAVDGFWGDKGNCGVSTYSQNEMNFATLVSGSQEMHYSYRKANLSVGTVTAHRFNAGSQHRAICYAAEWRIQPNTYQLDAMRSVRAGGWLDKVSQLETVTMPRANEDKRSVTLALNPYVLENVLPEATERCEEKTTKEMEVAYNLESVVVALLESVKELNARIEHLEAIKDLPDQVSESGLKQKNK